jgi:hypothetical protein
MNGVGGIIDQAARDRCGVAAPAAQDPERPAVPGDGVLVFSRPLDLPARGLLVRRSSWSGVQGRGVSLSQQSPAEPGCIKDCGCAFIGDDIEVPLVEQEHRRPGGEAAPGRRRLQGA